MKTLRIVLIFLLLPSFYIACEKDDNTPKEAETTTSTGSSNTNQPIDTTKMDTNMIDPCANFDLGHDSIIAKIDGKWIDYTNIGHANTNFGTNIYRRSSSPGGYPYLQISFPYDMPVDSYTRVGSALHNVHLSYFTWDSAANAPASSFWIKGYIKICEHDSIADHVKGVFNGTMVSNRNSADTTIIEEGEINYRY